MSSRQRLHDAEDGVGRGSSSNSGNSNSNSNNSASPPSVETGNVDNRGNRGNLSPSPSPSPSRSPDAPLEDDDDAAAEAAPDLPLTMMASTVLLGLPRDATAALATAGAFARDKVVVRFKAVGAPPLAGAGAAGGADVRRKIASTQKFDAVVAYVRRALRVGPTESVFLYVNSTFAPALDEVVGNLHRCFRDANDQLNVSYSLTPAFG